jgi:hypothetical protein
MRDLKRRVFQLLLLMSVGAMSVGCSSSTAKGGTGGSSATGGKGGSGGGGGGGAGGAGRMCGLPADAGGVCASAPCDGVIAKDFSTPDAGEIQYGVTTWPGPFIKPTYTTDDGTLHIMADFPQTAGPQYIGTTLYFLSCLDASAFTGVEFTISGSITSACQLVFGANDVLHDDHASDSKGSCDAGSKCYAPNMAVKMAVTSTPTAIQVPWITGSSVPDAPLDPSQLVGVQWQFTIGPAADGGTPENCTADLHISDVKFYH